MTQLAWGKKVAPEFASYVIGMAGRLHISNADWIMACMAMETGETFSPSIKNAAGSGAVGLIQFMPQTCASFGVTSAQMGGLSALAQLSYVERYIRPWAGRLSDLGDVYGTILWPAMIGKPSTAVIFDQTDPNHPKLYIQNRGLDLNKNGQITKAEITTRVQSELDRGLLPGNIATI